MSDFLQQLLSTQKAPLQEEPAPEETKENTLIGQADEFTVELDSDGFVHILDGEGVIRLSMPHLIWKQLVRYRS